MIFLKPRNIPFLVKTNDLQWVMLSSSTILILFFNLNQSLLDNLIQIFVFCHYPYYLLFMFFCNIGSINQIGIWKTSLNIQIVAMHYISPTTIMIAAWLLQLVQTEFPCISNISWWIGICSWFMQCVNISLSQKWCASMTNIGWRHITRSNFKLEDINKRSS